MKDGYGQFSFQNDRCWGVEYLDGHARSITLQIGKQHPDGVTMEQAKDAAQALLPTDARFAKKYMPYANSDMPSNEIVEVYHSQAIGQAFDGAEGTWFKCIPTDYYDKGNPNGLQGETVAGIHLS